MAKAFASIDEYLATQPAASLAALRSVRKIIRDALPEAEETISYGIPAFRLRGRVVLYFAGWKRHYSLYPVNDRLLAALKVKRGTYEVSKGTVRFPLSDPVPAKLIARIAKLKANGGP